MGKIRSNIEQAKKPTWLGDVGEPCGACCITMWWLDNKDYEDCEVSFPNNKEYGKFCIDYTKSVLNLVKPIKNIFDISKWTPFKLAKQEIDRINKAAKRKLKTTSIPLKSFRRQDLPERAQNATGETLCRNYFEFLQKLSETAIPGVGSSEWGVEAYLFNPDTTCDNSNMVGVLSRYCYYPCDINNKEVWDGSECVCAKGLESETSCRCFDDTKSEFILNKKIESNTVSEPNDIYPLGECKCRQENIDGDKKILTLLDPDSNCKDCECLDSEILGTKNKTHSVWNNDLMLCQCDVYRGLEEFSREIFLNRPRLICKCREANYVWNAQREECSLREDYIEWGKIDISQEFYSDSNLTTKIKCPFRSNYAKYKVAITVENLNNFSGADLMLNFSLTGNIAQAIQSYEIKALFQNDKMIVNRFRSATKKSMSGNPDLNLSDIPKNVSIGVHDKNDIINFGTSTSGKYIISYTIVTQIKQNINKDNIIGLKVSFLSTSTYIMEEGKIEPNKEKLLIIRKNHTNIGKGATTKEELYIHDPENCEEDSDSDTKDPYALVDNSADIVLYGY